MFKNFLLSLIVFGLFCCASFAIDLDTTVDDAIRKNYNVDAIKNIDPNQKPKAVTQKPVQTTKNNVQTIQSQPKTISGMSFPVRKGMEFDIANTSAISDRQGINSRVVFTNPRPIRTAYYTIPQGTKFVGKVTKIHSPQLTGNGGLVAINVNKIILSGNYQNINTRIVKTGDKHIFLKNIKGKRCYWKNTVAKGKWGRNIFHKMNKLSGNLAKDKATVILCPFTFIYGCTTGCISTITSPFVAIFTKGKRLIIPANTIFTIKFEEGTKLYY